MYEQHDDAIDLLKRDHREVEGLFSQFKQAGDDDERIRLAQRICSALSIHAKVEEELFYPAARDAMASDTAALIDEATVEHASLKQLISDIDGDSADDEMFAARMHVLEEYVRHHVREEETQLMPAVRHAVINLDTLGSSIAQRKEDLTKQAQSAMSTESGRAKRVSVPGIEAAVPVSRSAKRASHTSRKTTGGSKTKKAPSKRATKRSAAGKRKSNPESPRRSVARRKV